MTSRWGGIRKLPYAFTERGICMTKGLPRSSLEEKMVVPVLGNCESDFLYYKLKGY